MATETIRQELRRAGIAAALVSQCGRQPAVYHRIAYQCGRKRIDHFIIDSPLRPYPPPPSPAFPALCVIGSTMNVHVP